MARKTPFGIEKRFDRFGDWIGESWVWRKATPAFDRYPKATEAMTWLMRIGVGATFIVSGLSKSIDPWGTFYKISDYLQAMHMPLHEWGNSVIALSFFLFTIEFMIGLSLLLGCFRKAATICGSLVMAVMLPLTLWIAIADPVDDCGCFGDLFHISNWATFIKNCFLSLAFIWLLKFNSRCRCLIAPFLQWLMMVGGIIYVVAIGYIGFWQQPMLDFRPYPIGARLIANEDASEYSPVYSFIYEKDGKTLEINEDDEIPDENDGWKFVKRIEKGFDRNTDEGGGDGDFRIWSEDGKEDLSGDLATDERQLILLIPDIKNLSMATSWKINTLYDLAEEAGVDFFAVAAGSPSQIERWRDLTSGQYPIYTSEDTSIKELVRGNPALVALERGRIVWKSALSALRIEEADSYDDVIVPSASIYQGRHILSILSVLLISFLATLSLASLLRRF